jgi:hypothetical protein
MMQTRACEGTGARERVKTRNRLTAAAAIWHASKQRVHPVQIITTLVHVVLVVDMDMGSVVTTTNECVWKEAATDAAAIVGLYAVIMGALVREWHFYSRLQASYRICFAI